MVLEAPSKPAAQLQSLVGDVQTALRRDGGRDVYDFEVSAKGAAEDGAGEPAITVILKEDETTTSPVANLLSMTPTLEIMHGPAGSNAISDFLVQEVRRIFQDEQASIAYLLQGSSFSKAGKDFQLDQETTQAIEKRTTRAFKYASTYHITFSLFAASASPSAWDIE